MGSEGSTCSGERWGQRVLPVVERGGVRGAAVGAGKVHGDGEVELSTASDELQESGSPFNLCLQVLISLSPS